MVHRTLQNDYSSVLLLGMCRLYNVILSLHYRRLLKVNYKRDNTENIISLYKTSCRLSSVKQDTHATVLPTFQREIFRKFEWRKFAFI